jgi:chromatin segregation and condensation protein Rec8/ScpA/Scc1 (kleisin family)
LRADYPWNFKWTFSWLTEFPQVKDRMAFHAESNPYYKDMVRRQKLAQIEERARADPEFAEQLRKVREMQATHEHQEKERLSAERAQALQARRQKKATNSDAE